MRECHANIAEEAGVQTSYVHSSTIKHCSLLYSPTKYLTLKLDVVHYYSDRPITLMFVVVCRLSESNLQPISSQIEALFRSYSRAELSETLARIVFDACVSWSRIPERLITEHVLLIAILHRNVGSEVGEIIRHFSKLHLTLPGSSISVLI